MMNDKNYQVVFTEKAKVELMEVPMPEMKDNEVLVKSIVSQISTGTELTLLEGNVDEASAWNDDLKYPNYPGYSNIGEIVAAGKDMDKSLIGRKILTFNPHVKYGVSTVKEECIMIPDGVDPDEAVFGSIAIITLASARVCDMKLGETAVVFGAGLIGQFTARFAKLAGAVNVIVADVSDERLEMLPDDKCFLRVNSKKTDIIEFIKEHNNGRLADVVFETTSYPPLVETELKCIRDNGRLVITSSPKGSSVVDFDYCNRKGITIIGAHCIVKHPETATSFNQWTRERDGEYFMELLEKEQLSLKNLITHKANYKDAPALYKMLMEDRTKAMAVHLDWSVN